MDKIQLILYGDPRTKKNSPRIVKVKKKDGKSFYKIIPSKAFEKYQEECIPQLANYKILELDKKSNVKCIYYMKTKRKVDLPNLINATLDILVEAGVLEDDESNIVYTTNGSCVKYDKMNPRVEVAIEVYKEEL